MITQIGNFFKRSLQNPYKWVVDFFSGNAGDAFNVNEHESLRLSAVFACVKCIAESIAMLPVHIYKETPDGKITAKKHYLYTMLHLRPNQFMTKYVLFLTWLFHVVLWGNSYSELTINMATGKITGIYPLLPDRMKKRKTPDGQGVEYVYYSETKGEQIYPSWKILHLYGLGFDGLIGYSPIQIHRETIGHGLAINRQGTKFFQNGLNTGFVLEHPNSLGDTAYARLKASFSKKYEGLVNHHKPIILEEDMKIHKLGMPLKDAQYVEGRKFTVEEVCRLYRVPPHKVAHLEKATFSNIEQQSIDFVNDCLMPYIVLIEQVLNWDLFTPRERHKHYIKIDVRGLLRGTMKDRYEAYKIGINNTFLSPDDVRKLEDLNNLPDDQGKKFFQPLNMIDTRIAEQYLLSKNKKEGSKNG